MEEIQLKIKMTSNAKIYNVKIAKSDTILKLKEEVEKQTQIPPESQNLVYKGRILVNEKLVSDYNIENEHTIILVKKHTASQTQSESKPNTNTATTTNTSNTTTTSNTTNTNNTSANTNNNANPFGGMGMGGQMPDLASLLGNIDPNEISNMMQNMGGLGGLGGMDDLGAMGVNPQMIGQILSNPLYMQMMNNMLQNPQMIQMALNSPQFQQIAQNNPNMQALLNNPELVQQMINPQTLQMMSSMFGGMGNQGAGNTNTSSNPNSTAGTTQSTGNANPNPLGMDFSQLSQMLGNMGGLGGLGGLDGMGMGNMGNAGNAGTNDDNVDYKEKYKEQLAQLKDMGFINEETNIQVLKQCSGNVQFAIEKLINMLG